MEALPTSVRPRGRLPSRFDTLTVAQQLAAGGVERDQAEVIAKAIHDGLEKPSKPPASPAAAAMRGPRSAGRSAPDERPRFP